MKYSRLPEEYVWRCLRFGKCCLRKEVGGRNGETNKLAALNPRTIYAVTPGDKYLQLV